MDFWLLLVFSYFLGSLPFSYWAVKFLTGKDIRQHFSGNAGATNALRVIEEFASSEAVRTKAKLITKFIFLLDVSKGMAAVFLFQANGQAPLALCGGGAAILGHMFSPWLSFKGGKGVATALGMLLGHVPLVATLSFGVWYLVFKLSGFVSLGSVLAALGAPCLFFFLDKERFFAEPATTFILALMAIVITLKHKTNLKRIFEGTEQNHRYKKS